MAQITVTVDDGEVRTATNKVTMAIDRLPDKVIRKEMEQARDELRTYPAELPNQKYRRTGRRYQATKLQRVDKGKYRLESNPRYKYGRTANPYVVGDATGQGQARIHHGRWALIRAVIDWAMERIRVKGDEYFRSVLERNGPP